MNTNSPQKATRSGVTNRARRTNNAGPKVIAIPPGATKDGIRSKFTGKKIFTFEPVQPDQGKGHRP
jgi:hypothetical protein